MRIKFKIYNYDKNFAHAYGHNTKYNPKSGCVAPAMRPFNISRRMYYNYNKGHVAVVFCRTALNLISVRQLNRGLPNLIINPVKSYDNAYENKVLIFKENKDKYFIYRWKNKVNGKEYLGGTTSASSRLSTYFSLSNNRPENMTIYNAILKYGLINFSFEVVEYCTKDSVWEREQYYLDNFDFEYNISSGGKPERSYFTSEEKIIKLKEINTGKKHSETSIEKMRDSWAERKHAETLFSLSDSLRAKTGKVSISLKSKDSIVELAVEDLNKTTTLASEQPNASITPEDNTLRTPKPKKYITPGKIVVVTNIETNETEEYPSLVKAAESLGISRNTLKSYINQNNILTQIKGVSYSDPDKKIIYFKISLKPI